MGSGRRVDHLADLDAGLPDDATAARLRAAAEADPAAAAVLGALAATRAELAALPPPPVPPGVADRWAAALRAAATADGAVPGRPEDVTDRPAAPPHAAPPEGRARPASAPPGSADPVRSVPGDPRTPAPPPGPGSAPRPSGPPASRPRPARTGAHPPRSPVSGPPPAGHPSGPRRRRLAALAVGASVLVAALVAGVALLRPVAPPSISAAQLGMFATGSVGVTDLGGLADPARLAGCLDSVGRPGAQVLGGRRVLLDGTPGVLLVLTTGVLGRYDVVVVDPACGPGGGTVLGSDTVGG